jgi:hypothetical protein
MSKESKPVIELRPRGWCVVTYFLDGPFKGDWCRCSQYYETREAAEEDLYLVADEQPYQSRYDISK